MILKPKRKASFLVLQKTLFAKSCSWISFRESFYLFPLFNFCILFSLLPDNRVCWEVWHLFVNTWFLESWLIRRRTSWEPTSLTWPSITILLLDLKPFLETSWLWVKQSNKLSQLILRRMIKKTITLILKIEHHFVKLCGNKTRGFYMGCTLECSWSSKQNLDSKEGHWLPNKQPVNQSIVQELLFLFS